ncbi:putative serine esterase-domain-containing protein [Trametes elegans]|nr:putative serine esterase-domain-containing protein [Trametes elegans]
MSSTITGDAPENHNVHLLLLIHGMWGNPSHLAEMRRVIDERHGQAESEKGPNDERLHILVAETNRDDGTYDGIDWGGERVAEELYEAIRDLEKEGKKVTRFSVTGYSLGGLIARYVVGILHQRGFFNNVTPVNFNTIATPHVGLPRYPTLISSVANYLGPKLLSRTGEQFFLVDKWSQNGRPLLEVMADPQRLFFQALTHFAHVRIYANTVNDVTVPYPTAAIEQDDVFVNHIQDGFQVEYDEEYKPVIKSYTVPSSPPPPALKPRVLSAKWFKSMKSSRPLLPPALQFRFPYNVLMIALTPILVPVVLTLVLTRLSLASKKSRLRIKQLEKDETGAERLVHIIGSLEREVEDAVVDMFDSADGADAPAPTSASPSTTSLPANPTRTPSPDSPADSATALSAGAGQAGAQHEAGLVLNETQRKLVGWLNTLPGLKKELVFIHPVRNSHGAIICRDVKRFPSHRLGEGVLRHWADHWLV